MLDRPVRNPRTTRSRKLATIAVAVIGVLLAACGQGGGSATSSRSPSGSLTVPTSTRSSPGTTRTASGSKPATATSPASGPANATPERTSTTSTPATTTTTAITPETTTQTRTETRTETTTRTAVALPTSAPASTTSSETESTSEIPWWAWLLLLLVVAALVVGIPLLAGRRRREVEGWERPMADAEASAQWLHDRVLPTALAGTDPGPAAAAWSAVRPRFLELDEQLTGLVRTAPDDGCQAIAASLRAALADLATALDERSAATSAHEWATARLRVELARDRLERRLAHEPLIPPGQTHEVLVPPRTPPNPGDASSPWGEAGSSGGGHVQPHD
jgi:hypothetical protein